MSYATARRRDVNSEINKLYPEDRTVHEWYRFVLSFPPHLVREYLTRFGLDSRHQVLDPFCGTGTVLVESKKLGIQSIGVEANPIAQFASYVKANWDVDPDGLIEHARDIAACASARLSEDEIEDSPLFGIQTDQSRTLCTLSREQDELLLTGSMSPLPLHKTLVLLEHIEAHRDSPYYDHERLALAKAIVFSASNLHFGPEVGVGPAKVDAPVISPWLTNVFGMANDLRTVRDRVETCARVYYADARDVARVVPPNSIDAVFTSPPYPNEKDYTRTTRLESVLLGFIQSKADLRALKQGLLRSNTRNVYKGDDDHWMVAAHPTIQLIADAIEARRIELGKTSGFERLYATVTRSYFGGMAQHLAQLRTVLRPGAQLAYVVGDQASYLRILIPTGRVLAEIAQTLGYELVSIDLFRTRLATATREQLREEVVVLRWPGTIDQIARRYRQLPLGTDSTPGRRIPMAESQDAQRVANRYRQIMAHIFTTHYQPGMTEVAFEREELVRTAQELNIDVPLNLGDIPYSFRYRQQLPESIRTTAPTGQEWIIRSIGKSRYQFVLRNIIAIVPSPNMAETRIPDATPGIVARYAQYDEQGLLARIRYNRLIDIFTSTTCYSLQNHLRTTVPNVGQIETDEIYVGVDKRGVQYVFPVQAKGSRDRVGIVQIEQDLALCEDRFPDLICHPIAAQFLANDVIVVFAFEKQDDVAKIVAEKHYRLVPPDSISSDDLKAYRERMEE